MDDFLRAFDHNLARRNLRFRLLTLERERSRPVEALPHTFETEPLLEYAHRVLADPDVRRSEHRATLIELTGIADAVCGHDERGHELLDGARRRAEEPTERARFEYLVGHHVHFRRGDYALARRHMLEAVDRTETHRDLKSRALLVLGRVARQTDDYDSAERAYRQVLTVGVLAFRPLAMHYLSILHMHRGEHEEAIALNRRARAAMLEDGQRLGTQLADTDLAVFYMQTGRLDDALEVLEEVIAKHVELLDLNSAGQAYHNLGVVEERRKDWDRARDAYRQAARYLSATGRHGQLSVTYRNLNNVFLQQGQDALALAACERSIAYARRIDAFDAEIRARAAAMQIMADRRIGVENVAAEVARCQEILEAHASDLTREGLRRYARVVGELALMGVPLRAGVASPSPDAPLAPDSARRALEAAMGTPDENEFRDLLLSRIGAGVPGPSSPPPDEICDFLMLFAGDYFQFKHYAEEFQLTPGRVKHHLRGLVERNIIELTGTRKAAKYSLAFHRR